MHFVNDLGDMVGYETDHPYPCIFDRPRTASKEIISYMEANLYFLPVELVLYLDTEQCMCCSRREHVFALINTEGDGLEHWYYNTSYTAELKKVAQFVANYFRVPMRLDVRTFDTFPDHTEAFYEKERRRSSKKSSRKHQV